jgi:hypothetical protein
VSARTITHRRWTRSGPAARLAVPVVLAIAPAACGGDDPLEAINPIGGLYNLVTCDGAEPPVVTEDGGDAAPTTKLIAGLLVLSFNETCTLAADYRVTDGGETSFFSWNVAGDWVADAEDRTSVTILPDSAGIDPFAGSVAGDRMTLSFEGVTWVLER